LVADLYATFDPANALLRRGVKEATGREPRTFEAFARENATAFK
jgi:hypothetical protein